MAVGMRWERHAGGMGGEAVTASLWDTAVTGFCGTATLQKVTLGMSSEPCLCATCRQMALRWLRKHLTRKTVRGELVATSSSGWFPVAISLESELPAFISEGAALVTVSR